MSSGKPVDVRDLGTGNHYITAILNPIDRNKSDVRMVWNVRVSDPGDVNGDGHVGFTDFILLSREFGNPSGRHLGDLDYSGVVGFGDFIILSQNYGGRSGARTQNVPEPSPLQMAFCACLPLLGLRRRRR